MSSAAASKPQPYSRSRQTVVCTECKRLKIKCDRQVPCSGCAKRSNDPRVCVYLTPNTERPDLGVIWTNQRETDLKVESLAIRVDEIQENYLPRRVVIPTQVIVSSSAVALGSSGIPTVVALDSITALYVNTLGIQITRVDVVQDQPPSSQSGGGIGGAGATASSYLPHSHSMTARVFSADESLQLIAAFYPDTPSNPHLPAPNPILRPRALITPAILNNIPTAESLEALFSSLNSVLTLHPLCSVNALESRLRDLREGSVSVAGFAVAASAMTLASLAYLAERKAWKLPSEVPEAERDVMKLFDLARLAIRLSGDALSEEDSDDIVLSVLLLIVFTLHALELDGWAAVCSGVAPRWIKAQLGSWLDQLRRRAEAKSLLVEGSAGRMNLYAREQRRLLAAATAHTLFHVEDLISNNVTIDNTSYTTDSPSTYDDNAFKPTSMTLPPPSSMSGAQRNTFFATQSSKIVKNILQARTEIVYGRDQERDLMIAAAEAALNNTNPTTSHPVPPVAPDDKSTIQNRIAPLLSPAGDILMMWDDRLNRQREDMPRAMLFDNSPEYASEIGIVFGGDPRPLGAYEPTVTLAMGYTIAQQAEAYATLAYYRMRFAALLLENTLIYKPRGSPPHSTMAVAIVKALEAAQDLIAALKIQKMVLKKKVPLALSNYSWGRRVFDAGVVCGVLASVAGETRNAARHTVTGASEGLVACMDILRDLESWLRVKEGVPDLPPASLAGADPHLVQQHAAQPMSPPLRILVELAERAGVKAEDGLVENVGPRRKRNAFDLEENETAWDGLILAYVMGGWVVGKQTGSSTSWLGQPQQDHHLDAPVAGLNGMGSMPTLAGTDPLAQSMQHYQSQEDNVSHRSKRPRVSPTGLEGYLPDSIRVVDENTEDPQAKRRTSDHSNSSGSNGRPSSRPALAVRARVADGSRRPKRRPAPSPTKVTNGHGVNGKSAGQRVKNESTPEMDGIDEEDYEDQFAFSVDREPPSATMPPPGSEYGFNAPAPPGPPTYTSSQVSQPHRSQAPRSQRIGVVDAEPALESPIGPASNGQHYQQAFGVGGAALMEHWSQDASSRYAPPASSSQQGMYGPPSLMMAPAEEGGFALPTAHGHSHSSQPMHHHQPPTAAPQPPQPQQPSGQHMHGHMAYAPHQPYGAPQHHSAQLPYGTHQSYNGYSNGLLDGGMAQYSGGMMEDTNNGAGVGPSSGVRKHPQLTIAQTLGDDSSGPSSAVTMPEGNGQYYSSGMYNQSNGHAHGHTQGAAHGHSLEQQQQQQQLDQFAHIQNWKATSNYYAQY